MTAGVVGTAERGGWDSFEPVVSADGPCVSQGAAEVVFVEEVADVDEGCFTAVAGGSRGVARSNRLAPDAAGVDWLSSLEDVWLDEAPLKRVVDGENKFFWTVDGASSRGVTRSNRLLPWCEDCSEVVPGCWEEESLGFCGVFPGVVILVSWC